MIDPSVISRLKDVINQNPQVGTFKLHLERTSPLTNIPRPPAVGFVRRRDSQGRDLLEWLEGELAPKRNQVIALIGPGGVGKTTLASEAARAVSKLFGSRIVWTSALGRDDYSIWTLLDEIAAQLGHSEIRALPPATKTQRVQAVIAAAPTLIVLDNFETVRNLEQTQCLEFLAKRAACSVLITSRQIIGNLRNITISMMSTAEANDFLNRLIEQSSNPLMFAERDRDRVITASERNPLVMQWMVGQIDLGRDSNSVLGDLFQGTGDAAVQAFDRSFDLGALGDDGRAVLLALSLFVPDASRAAIADVAGFGTDENRVSEAVRRLASLFLVKSISGSRLSVIGLTRELAKARLSKNDNANEFRKRYIAHFVKYAETHSQPTPQDYDRLEPEKENLLNAMDVAFDSRDWQSVQRIAKVLVAPASGMLATRGYWEEAIQRGEQAIDAAREGKNDVAIAQFSGNTATLRMMRGEYDEARQGHQLALKVFRKLKNDENIAVALHQLANLSQYQGELNEARRLYNESLEIRRKLDNQSGIATTLHNLAALAQAQGDLAEARKLYNESLEIAKKLDDQSGIASTLHQLGMLEQQEGGLEDARRLYKESLEIEKKRGNQSGIAITLHQLATLAQDQGRLEEARQLYHESLEIGHKLGDQSGIALALGRLGTLHESEGNSVEAAKNYREALEIFEKLGSPNAEVARRSLSRVESTIS